MLLLLLLLGSHCELLELISVHFHVRSDDLVRDRSHSLVPMLLLGAIEKALNNDRVGLDHILANHFLHRL